MITGNSTAFQAMIGSNAQTIAVRIQILTPDAVTHDFHATVTQFEIEAATTTDAPDQTRLQFGQPTMTLEFTLAGIVDYTSGQTANDWFGKYNTASPFYQQDIEGCPVYCDLGLVPAGAGSTPEYARKYTGLVDTVQQNSDGTVDFTCIDNHGQFRGIVTTPDVITAAPYNAGLTPEFVLDNLLRSGSNGAVGTWPAQRPQCVLAAGMRTSMWPEIGTLQAGSNQPIPTFAPGPYGSGLAAADQIGGGYSEPVYLTSGPIGRSVFVELFINGLASGGLAVVLGDGLFDAYQFTFTPTRLTIQYGTHSYAWSVSIDTGTHYVGMQLALPAAGSGAFGGGTFILDTATHAIPTDTTTARNSASWNQVALIVRGAASLDGSTMAGLQVTTETSPAGNGGFIPQAVLAPSLNPLTVIPQVTDDLPTIAQGIAEDELGVAGWWEDGTFRTYNRKQIASQDLATTITLIEDIAVSGSAASVINRCQIPYFPWTFDSTASQVYSQTSVIKVPARGKVTFTAPLTGPAVNLDTTWSKPANGAISSTMSQYRASNDAAGLTEFTSNSLTFTTVKNGSASVTVTIANSGPIAAYLVSPSNYSDLPVGTPLFTIAGTAVTAGQSQIADYQWPDPSIIGANGQGGAAGTKWGEVPYAPTGNGWCQDPDAALTMAQDVVADGCIARPNFVNVQIMPNWLLQLLDRVFIASAGNVIVNEYATIFGWTITGQNGSMTMSVDARALCPPGAWLLGVAGRSELGSTTYLYA